MSNKPEDVITVMFDEVVPHWREMLCDQEVEMFLISGVMGLTRLLDDIDDASDDNSKECMTKGFLVGFLGGWNSCKALYVNDREEFKVIGNQFESFIERLKNDLV